MNLIWQGSNRFSERHQSYCYSLEIAAAGRNLIIAWFSPEIPFRFGPLGYGGLPGLILELEVQSNFPAKYTIETIDFSKKNIKIEVPIGKKITPLELDQMAKKGMNNLRN